MKKFWEKVEHYNIKLIPYALVILLGIIVMELFVHSENHYVELAIEIGDYFVLVVFVIDLIFLAIKARSTSFFFKHYWLDLLAVFPFSLIFSGISRIYAGVAEAERLLIGQSILHEAVETEKIIAKESKLLRIVRVMVRSLRLITKSRLFTQFHEKHHRARHKLFHQKKR